MNLGKIFKDKHSQSLIGQLLASLIAVFSFMILARGYSKEDFGQWVLYLSLITFFDMIKAGMVQSAFIKYASGAAGTVFCKLQGSSWLLNIAVTGVFSFLCLLTYFIGDFQMEGWEMFLLIYPLYAIFSMPFQYFLWNAQIKLNFKQLAIGRISNALLFFFVTSATLVFSISLYNLFFLHLLVFAFCSISALIFKKTGIRNITQATRKDVVKFWKFGRYHSLAFLGSNLLKSSDTFIIGGLLGPMFIAVYSIPLRLVEIIELPLRSASSVAFPVFSAHDNAKDLSSLKKSLESYVGTLTILYVPFMLGLFVVSDYLVFLIGGEKYADTGSIFRLFLIYGLFLPFDRLTGVVLDAMGFPRLNFYKVAVMALVNIVGDVVVLYFFKSLELVAAMTIANVLTGTIIGFCITKQKLKISLRTILYSGLLSIINSINQLKNLSYENENTN